LNLPATRTCPEPTIFPSIDRPEEITDSFIAGRSLMGAGVLEAEAAGEGDTAGGGTGAREAGSGVAGVEFGVSVESFHSAMAVSFKNPVVPKVARPNERKQVQVPHFYGVAVKGG
jgi:hypothetical protein